MKNPSTVEATASLSSPANARGNIQKVETGNRMPALPVGNGKPAGKSKAKDKPKAKAERVSAAVETIEVKNRKGRVYSLDADLFSHTGSLIPFANAKATIDYCRLHKVGKSKPALKKAKAEYVGLKAIHNTMICIVYAKLGKGFDLRRLTVRRLVKTPEVKAVAIAGRTDSDVEAIEAFAVATAQGQERRERLSK